MTCPASFCAKRSSTSFFPTTSSNIEGKGGRRMLPIFSWCRGKLGGCAHVMKTTEEEEKEKEEEEVLQKECCRKGRGRRKRRIMLQEKKHIELLSTSRKSWQVIFSINIFSQT